MTAESVKAPLEAPDYRLRKLRAAIRKNLVTFPSQAPVFAHNWRIDIQWRLALLYFVLGWSCARIGKRYGFTKQRAQQVISQWTSRAVASGYIQRIPPSEANS